MVDINILGVLLPQHSVLEVNILGCFFHNIPYLRSTFWVASSTTFRIRGQHSGGASSTTFRIRAQHFGGASSTTFRIRGRCSIVVLVSTDFFGKSRLGNTCSLSQKCILVFPSITFLIVSQSSNLYFNNTLSKFHLHVV